MAKFIPKRLTQEQNSTYKGFAGEVATLNDKAVVVYNGVTEGGSVIKDSVNNAVNIIRNGNFTVQQNAPAGGFFSAIPTNGAFEYIYDGWYLQAGGGSVSNVSTAYLSPSTDISLSCRFNVTSGGAPSSFTLLSQRIAGIERFLGKTLTIGFKAKANGNFRFSVECQSKLDTGNAADDNNIFVTTGETKANWQYYTATFKMPDVPNSTAVMNSIGENNHLALYIWIEAGSNWDSRTGGIDAKDVIFDITNIKLEEGEVATPFIARPYSQEFNMVAEYYEKKDRVIYFSSAGLSAPNDTVALNVEVLPKRKSIELSDINITTSDVSNVNFRGGDAYSFSYTALATSPTASARVTSLVVNQEIPTQ